MHKIDGPDFWKNVSRTLFLIKWQLESKGRCYQLHYGLNSSLFLSFIPFIWISYRSNENNLLDVLIKDLLWFYKWRARRNMIAIVALKRWESKSLFVSESIEESDWRELKTKHLLITIVADGHQLQYKNWNISNHPRLAQNTGLNCKWQAWKGFNRSFKICEL